MRVRAHTVNREEICAVCSSDDWKGTSKSRVFSPTAGPSVLRWYSMLCWGFGIRPSSLLCCCSIVLCMSRSGRVSDTATSIDVGRVTDVSRNPMAGSGAIISPPLFAMCQGKDHLACSGSGSDDNLVNPVVFLYLC